MMKKKFKILLPTLAVMLLLGTFAFPTTAYAQVNDTTPPTITATLSGDTLTATAKDEDTGVAAIFVGAHEFSTLADGVATLPFKEYAGVTAQKVEVYAVDMAGNRSESVLITNPWYVAPASNTPPPAMPVSSSPAPTASASAPTAALPASSSSLPSSSSASSSGSTPTPATSVPEAQPPTSSAIPGAANPLTPDGGGTVQDSATEEDGKEFFTVTTAAGNVYYLVVDRQRGTENVYFLSPVTEDDLLGLAESDAPVDTDPAESQPQPEPPVSSEPTSEPAEQPAQGGFLNIGAILFVLLGAGAFGGVMYYIKIAKPKKQATEEEAYEEDFEDEEPGKDEYFFGEEQQGAQDEDT